MDSPSDNQTIGDRHLGGLAVPLDLDDAALIDRLAPDVLEQTDARVAPPDLGQLVLSDLELSQDLQGLLLR